MPIGQALGQSFGDPPTFAYPLIWSYRRHGGRGRRQDRRHQLERDDRGREVHGRGLEGLLRRGRPRLGRRQQQPRLPVRHGLLDAQRRLDLHRDARASPTSTRRQTASRSRTTSCTRRCRPARRASSASTPITSHVMPSYSREPEGRQGPAQVHPHEGELRAVVHDRPGLLHARHDELGDPPDVGARIRS